MNRNKTKPILAVVLMLLAIIVIVLLASFIKRYIPSKEMKDLSEYYGLVEKDDTAIIIDREYNGDMGKYWDNTLYINYDMLHEKLNKRFYWDKNEKLLLYATSAGIVSATTDSKEYNVGKEKKSIEHTIARVSDEVLYIAADFIKLYTDMDYEYYGGPNRVMLTTKWETTKQAAVKKATQIRVRGGIKSPILKQVEKEEKVIILEKGDNWDKVCTVDGLIGYIKNKKLREDESVSVEHEFTPDSFSKIKHEGNVNMVWHQVTDMETNARISKLLEITKGVNVVSPTWFYLNDNEGNIGSFADANYVNECHDKGMQVWGLISNLVNMDVNTSEVLTHTSRRNNLVNQIVAAAIQYNLDGINVDLESINSEVGDSYVQFIRELALKCHNNDLIISVDNYVPMSYNAFYDRKEQSEFVDYIVIMGYDEHYAGSDEGSVASIGFVSDGVKNTLAEVPSDQIILGMPFYTRMWMETPKADVGDDVESSSDEYVPYDLSSQAYGMVDAENMVEVNGVSPIWDDATGQYYAEYVKDDVTYKVWLETAESIDKKLQVMKENNLAGAAFWKLGLEKSNVWDTVIKYMGN